MIVFVGNAMDHVFNLVYPENECLKKMCVIMDESDEHIVDIRLVSADSIFPDLNAISPDTLLPKIIRDFDKIDEFTNPNVVLNREYVLNIRLTEYDMYGNFLLRLQRFKQNHPDVRLYVVREELIWVWRSTELRDFLNSIKDKAYLCDE